MVKPVHKISKEGQLWVKMGPRAKKVSNKKGGGSCYNRGNENGRTKQTSFRNPAIKVS